MMPVIHPKWPAPARVRALVTTRVGGVSAPPFQSLNLATHVGDLPAAVEANRARLVDHARLAHAPLWLDQVHGTEVVVAGDRHDGVPVADAAVTRASGVACAILTADCLPVLFCRVDGLAVGAAHAGWRGLAGGVLERTRDALGAGEVIAWLGPAIGPASYQVGPEVRAAFVSGCAKDADAFHMAENDQFYADLYALARARLARVGVTAVYGGEHCTLREPERFFSYRRDRVCGRMASLIWLEEPARHT